MPRRLIVCLLYGFGSIVALKELVADSRKSRADHRAEQECPEACQRLEVAAAHCAEGGTEAAGGVYGGAGEADAEEVNYGKGKTDNNTAEGAVLSLFGGNSENCEYENSGEDDFNKEARKVVSVYAVHCVCAEAVKAELSGFDTEKSVGLADMVGQYASDPTHRQKGRGGRRGVNKRDNEAAE